MYSAHVRYLRIQGWILPDEVLEDYLRLFPDRPLLPRVQSINMWSSSACHSPCCLQWSRFLLRSSTLAENQPSASASTIKHLGICYPLSLGDSEGARLLALDLVAFQHSNVKLGGGLDVSIKINSYTLREFGSMFLFGFQALRDTIEEPFVLPTVNSPAQGLSHLEVAQFLGGIP